MRLSVAGSSALAVDDLRQRQQLRTDLQPDPCRGFLVDFKMDPAFLVEQVKNAALPREVSFFTHRQDGGILSFLQQGLLVFSGGASDKQDLAVSAAVQRTQQQYLDLFAIHRS